MSGALAAGLIAAASGYLLGLRARPTPEDLAPGGGTGTEMQHIMVQEVNRTLMELWKMESLERAPNLR